MRKSEVLICDYDLFRTEQPYNYYKYCTNGIVNMGDKVLYSDNLKLMIKLAKLTGRKIQIRINEGVEDVCI